MHRKRPEPTLRDGFHVMPAENGGWVLNLRAEPGQYMEPNAAFTSDQDLVSFLQRELRPQTKQLSASEVAQMARDAGLGNYLR